MLEEYFEYRSSILEESKDENGFLDDAGVLEQAVQYMLETKLMDNEEYTYAAYEDEDANIKVNGYAVSEGGERLQLFIVDEESLAEGIDLEDASISHRADYESEFKRCRKFAVEAITGKLLDELQASDPVGALATRLADPDGFEVIEIVLVSMSLSVSYRGQSPQPNSFHFPSEEKTFVVKTSDGKSERNVLFIKKLVDVNFLAEVIVSQGRGVPLKVEFRSDPIEPIEAIQAYSGDNFESWLCVLSATDLAHLYRRHGSRLLEKNVRSFLQFKGANKGIKETIRNEPEKFIAYNNGLTITATDADITTIEKGKKKVINSLTDLQIVNGGQTTASIYFSKKEGLDVSKVKVMAKINIVRSEKQMVLNELVSNISKYSNTQSRVSNVDLNARSPQLVKLKQLSESVKTPTAGKWYFERAKGEFNTEVRKQGASAGARLKRDFPPAKRFSKEQLAKFYCAWGEEPYLVKRGGEKVFRHMMEVLEPEEGIPLEVDRDFYEQLIAKIILFKRMEKIYGQGVNAIGQLRSAAIPYALSIIYVNSDGAGKTFDLARIWKDEDIREDLAIFLKSLLSLVNDLIKQYSQSDDFGEYSKKKELWSDIVASPEIKKFLSYDDSQKILAKYIKDSK